MNAGAKERFVGVDVADSHYDPVIHDEGFHCQPSISGTTEKIIAAQGFGQRFRAVIGEQGMNKWVVGGPQQGAELADIVKSQADAAGKADISVIVATGRGRLLENAQKAAHAQVQDQAAAGKAEQ